MSRSIVEVTDPQQDIDAEFRTERRPQAECPGGFVAEVADPASDDGSDALRNRDVEGREVGLIGEPSFRRQEANGLADEQRVAFGGSPDRRDDRVPGRKTGRGTEVLADRIRGQASQLEHASNRLAGELGDRRRQWVLWRQLDVAVGSDHHHRHVAELARQEAQEQDRRGIGRLQVVEDDEHRPPEGHVPQQRCRRVEELETRGLGGDVGRWRQVGEHVPQLRQDVGHVDGPGSRASRRTSSIGVDLR